MKTFFNNALRCSGQAIAFFGKLTGKSMIVVCFAAIVVLFSGCKKEAHQIAGEETTQESSTHDATAVDGMNCSGLNGYTTWQLQQARAATAKYKHIKNAIKDGYVDIGVVVPNMGHHYMKSSLVDGHFDFRKPEILVYNKEENGKFKLVAVEYAVPLSEPMPQGFSGSADVWDGNAGFQLWLLHAWVWTYNPSGIFNPTNPLVHLHEH